MTSTNEAGPLTVGEYLSAIRPVPADVRISYDEGPSQWIDIFRPVEPASSAVIILVHGGCWSAAASAETTSPNAAELAVNGVTVCNVEYRRIGEPGGGFPGTFHDVAKAAETLRARALELQLDLSRVIVVGHSAGAHLALWMASRAKLPTGSPLHVADPLKIHSVVAIAGPGDLRNHARLMGITCAGLSRLDQLVGEPTPSRPDPLADTSPFDLLPTGVRTVSITGVYDDNWPPHISQRWHRAALAAGDDAEELLLPDCGHFDLMDVRMTAWHAVRDAILAEVRRAP